MLIQCDNRYREPGTLNLFTGITRSSGPLFREDGIVFD